MNDNINTASPFEVKTANQWSKDAVKRADPVPLWGTLWFENEMACLFADTNVGKSILAVQIADQVAREGHRVLYLDFEMSDKQFQLRYSEELRAKEDGATAEMTLHRFSENFFRCQPSPEVALGSMEQMIGSIESLIVQLETPVVVIDNLTWICNAYESGDAAGELMQMLVRLKKYYDLSILCVAHTPKRAIDTPLTQNTLAGSKRIANFMDSIFAIGIDRTREPRGRYIKQIKVRSAECLYGEDNVIRCDLEKQGSMLRFAETGFGHESDMLEEPAVRQSREILDDEIVSLLAQGKTYREITSMLKVSNKTVLAVKQRRNL